MEQMRELRLGMEDGVDMLGVANPTLSAELMREHRSKCQELSIF